MTNKYRLLIDLENLKKSGMVSEEEYQRERQRIMNADAFDDTAKAQSDLGMQESTYLMLMHLSQLAGFIILGLGFVVPLIMWLMNKDKRESIDRHGKNIMNFIISWIIYYIIAIPLIFIFFIGIPLLIVLGILQIIFVIIAAIKANNNEYWQYPLSIPFFINR